MKKIILLKLCFLLSCASASSPKIENNQTKAFEGKLKISVYSANVKGLKLNEAEVLQEIKSVLTESDSFEMYDRKNLDLILKEKQLTMSGLVEKSDYRKLGQLTGIDSLVNVKSFILEQRVFMIIQLFSTQNAEILASVYFEVPNDKLQMAELLKTKCIELSEQFINRANYQKGIEKTKVAVVQIEDTATTGVANKNLSQWIPILESGLVSNFSLNVISRSELELIMNTRNSEKKLALTGLMSNEDLKEIRKVSGVKFIIIASLNEVNGLTANKFNIQAIHSETALSRSSETIKKNSMSLGLEAAARSIAERITLSKDKWTSFNNAKSKELIETPPPERSLLGKIGNFFVNIFLLPFKYVYNVPKAVLDLIVIRPIVGLGAGAKVSLIEVQAGGMASINYFSSEKNPEIDSLVNISTSRSNKKFDNEYYNIGIGIVNVKEFYKSNTLRDKGLYLFGFNFIPGCDSMNMTVLCNQPSTISANAAAGLGIKITIVLHRIPELVGVIFFQNWDLLDSGVTKERFEYFTD